MVKACYICILVSFLFIACTEEKQIAQSNQTGVLIDERDSRTYQTVLIGNRWWRAENLNHGIQVNPFAGGVIEPTDNDITEKYCYDNNETLCETYGGLYIWDEAMNYSTDVSAQGLCPDDWYVPSIEDYQDLLGLYPDCPQLRINGESGFNALLGGNRYYLFFDHLGAMGVFWTSSGSQLYGH